VEFTLTTASVDGTVVVAAAGDLDMKTAPDLQARVEEVFADEAKSVVIDLTDVGFLDSSGLGAIAAARNEAGKHDAQLAVVCSNPNVLKLFRITGMDRVLTIHASLDDAS
jgi:anti-sigma B factor antagonist